MKKTERVLTNSEPFSSPLGKLPKIGLLQELVLLRNLVLRSVWHLSFECGNLPLEAYNVVNI